MLQIYVKTVTKVRYFCYTSFAGEEKVASEVTASLKILLKCLNTHSHCCDQLCGLLQKHNISISMTEDNKPTDNAIAERDNGTI